MRFATIRVFVPIFSVQRCVLQPLSGSDSPHTISSTLVVGTRCDEVSLIGVGRSEAILLGGGGGGAFRGGLRVSMIVCCPARLLIESGCGFGASSGLLAPRYAACEWSA